ncbi:MAG: PKD domain-containing protein [Bacteroidota bacterium]
MLRFYTQMLLVFLCSIGTATAQVTVDFTANRTSGCGFLQVGFTDLSSSSAGNIVAWNWDFDGATAGVQNPGNVFSNPGRYTICLSVTDDQGNTGQACKTDYIQVYTVPEPDFEADPEAGCAPLNVVFTDLTTAGEGAITERIWGVGGVNGVIIDDGSSPTVQNDYPLPDNYTISLTVSDANGCSNTVTKSNYVRVNQAPPIDVSAAIRDACEPPFVVDFVNNDPRPDIIYTWDFGDGQTYTGPTPPPITYSNSGVFDVYVRAEEPNSGCFSETTLSEYIRIDPEIQIRAAAESVCIDGRIIFEDLSGVPVDSLVWDFGDGVVSNATRPNHRFRTLGCFTVSVTRYATNGCVTMATYPTCIQVNDRPVVDYTIDRPIGCDLPHVVTLTSTTPNAATWEWSLGNGTISTEENPTISIENYGVYPVSLRVVDVNGCASRLRRDSIIVQELNAEKDFFVQVGCVPLDVTLTQASISVVPIVSYSWEVSTADGSAPGIVFSSSLETPTFTLADTGAYNVTLEVTNSLGCVNTETFPYSILAGMPPVPNFQASETNVCYSDGASFEDLSSDYTNAWLWDFGDGTFSEEQNPRHNFLDTGYYDVTLTALHYGCPATVTIDDVVRFLPPISNYINDLSCDRSLDRTFTAISVGADSVYWDFGIENTDTDTSTAIQPLVTFPEAGVYDVTLISFNETAQCSDTLVQAITITDPVASFSVSENLGCPPFEIAIQNESESANRFRWTAPDGLISNDRAKNPTIVFEDPGFYTDISLIITDIYSCTDTIEFTDTIHVVDVDPRGTPESFYSCGPGSIQFEDQSTSTGGEIVRWSWGYGTGDFGREQNPSYTYTEDGVYTLRLIVEDENGCEERRVYRDAVVISIPVPSFNVQELGCTQASVPFNNTSTGQDLTYLWDFGDGNFSTDPNPDHQYAAEGSYTVCLTVADPQGCDSTYCMPDPLLIANPVANFTADNTLGTCPPMLVNFENLSQYATQFQWDFGDDSGSSNLESPPKVYTEPGVYDVSLVVSSAEGCVDSIRLEDFITLEGPVGEFEYTVLESCLPGRVSFVGESLEEYDFIWDFGNGVLDTTYSVSSDSFVFNYENFGDFTPKLILANLQGCERILEGPDEINIEGMTFDFSATETLFCNDPDLTTAFNFEESSSSPIVDFRWDFEGADTPTSTDLAPQVSYTTPGTFDVMLYLDNGVCRDSLLKEDYIRIGEVPDADFSSTSLEGCLPFPIDFSDNSTVATSTIVDWDWTFAGADSSKLQNPSYLFDQTGEFEVNLTVTSAIGCSATHSETVRVNPLPEVAISSEADLCIGQETQIETTILSDPNGMSFQWTPDPNMSCTDCPNPVVSPNATTEYTLRVTDGNGCSDVFTHTVTVLPFPAPVVDLTADTTICLNAVVQLIADVESTVPVTYQWDDSQVGLNCYQHCKNPVATPLQPTTYTVTVTNTYGCSTEESVFVDIINETREFISADQTICTGEVAQLDINYGLFPEWVLADRLDCTNCFDPVATPETTTTYWARVTTENGCRIEDSVTVFVQAPQEIDAGEDQVLCRGQVIFLNGTGNGTVTWTPDQRLSNPNILNPMADPFGTTTYVLAVDDGTCTAYDSVTVNIIGEVSLDQTGDQTICAGDTVQLSVLGGADEYTWFPETGLADPYAPSTTASPEETTTYRVVGTIFGCQSDTVEITVNVNPKPELNLLPRLDFFPDNEVALGSDQLLSNDYRYAWSPAETLSCSDCPNPVARPTETTTYQVRVDDLSTGCFAEEMTVLRLRTDCGDDLVFAPNIFSPNNDGINDRFELLSSTVNEISLMQVYNRWGALVFETRDMREGWDGTGRGGDVMSDGVYVYFVEAICPLDGSTIRIQGDITISK